MEPASAAGHRADPQRLSLIGADPRELVTSQEQVHVLECRDCAPFPEVVQSRYQQQVVFAFNEQFNLTAHRLRQRDGTHQASRADTDQSFLGVAISERFAHGGW